MTSYSDIQGILHFGHIHPANLRGLQWLAAKCSFPVIQVDNIQQAIRYPGFWLILATDQVIPNIVPNKLIISGPHLFSHHFPRKVQGAIFNCLAPWVQRIIRHTHPELQTIAAPFPLPYDEIKPTINVPKTKIILYSKYRSPDLIEKCYQMVQQTWPDVDVMKFVYGQYNLQNWLDALDHACLIVFVIGTESQGFAVQEAMCMDVPVLLFDVPTVNECYFDHDATTPQWFEHPLYPNPIFGTAKNLWDARCGEHITNLDKLPETLQKMKLHLSDYHPRLLILEEMTPEKCLQRFLAPTKPLQRECVVICSCVHTVEAPLCYAPIRSVFSAEQRFQQLLGTLNSVEKYLPQAHIFVAEASQWTNTEIQTCKRLYPRVTLKQFHTHPIIAKQRDSPYKGPTEMYMLLELMPEITKYDFLRKLSGRYQLNAQILAWPNLSNSKAPQYYHKNQSTVCYGVPRELYPDYCHRLQKTIDTCKNDWISVEDVLFDNIPSTLVSVGVQGLLFNGEPLCL